jgi:hypothetical protein
MEPRTGTRRKLPSSSPRRLPGLPRLRHRTFSALGIALSVSLVCATPAAHVFAASKDKPADNTQSPTPANADSQTKSTGASQSAGTTSPPAASSGPIESQILAYEALTNRATAIASFVDASVLDQENQKAHAEGVIAPVNLVVLDPTSMNLPAAFKSFQLQARLLRQNICAALNTPKNQADEGKAFAIPTASQFTAAAGALTAVLALFKETKTVTPNSIAMPDEALVAAVASALRVQRPALSIYYPAEYPIGVGAVNFDPAVVSDGTDRVKVCNIAASDSAIPSYGLLIGLQFLRSTAASEAAELNAKSAKEKATWSSKLAALNAAIQQFDAIAANLASSASSTAVSPWDAIVRGEQMARLLTEHSYVVQLKVQSAGGAAVTLDGAFFLTGASYYYSGGAIFTAIVYDNAGSLKAAKNFWMMSGDQKRKTFSNRTNP